MKTIKILQLPSYYIPYGGTFCKDQSLLLMKAGFKVDVLANLELSWKREGWDIFTHPYKTVHTVEDGMDVYRNYFRRIPFLKKTNVERWTRKTLRLFERYVARNGMPDVIHVHSAMWAGYAAAFIKEKYKIPYVLTEHNGAFGYKSQYAKYLLKGWFTPYMQKAFANADFIIPVSTQLIPKIKELAPSTPIRVISNVFNQMFQYNYRKHGKDKFTFFNGNSYLFVKGYDILLPAFDQVCDSIKNVELRIAGLWFEQDSFQQLLKQCRHKDKIVVLGNLSLTGVRDELCKADSFVLASRVESQSVAVLEALATGLPVVCTDVVPEEIVTEKQGYRVHIEDSNALANAMIRMIQTVDTFNGEQISLHAQMVAGGENFVRQMTEVYEAVLS